MKFKYLALPLLLILTQRHGLAQEGKVDMLPLAGIKLDTAAQERIAKAYCQDLTAELKFIDSLNNVAAENAKNLKVGSTAEYLVTNVRLDRQGKEIERFEQTETWRVKDIKDNQAQVVISSEKLSDRVEAYKIFPHIYGQKPDSSQPMSCLYWRAFAESKKQLEYNLNGTKIPAIYRAQTVFSNVLPEFTYGKGVPFNILETRESSDFSNSKVIKTRKLKSFHF